MERTRKARYILIGTIFLVLMFSGCTEEGDKTGDKANTKPVAYAGPDQEVATGSTVYIEGFGYDADEDHLTYSWNITSPSGAEVTPTVIDPPGDNSVVSFTADKDGEYRIILIVNDGTVNSDPDFAIVTAEESFAQTPRWYKGDLHAHSTNSDGDIDVGSVIALAENKGFDYFVLTDHNTNTQWTHPDYRSSEVTLLYGVEWTTGNGHANIWSNKPFDWASIKPSVDAMNAKDAIDLTHSLVTENQEILFSINHPYAIGCEWNYSFEDSRAADCMEVWNSGYLWPNMNFQTAATTLDEYLSGGKRITMVGGSDSHAHGTEIDDETDYNSYYNYFQTYYHDIGIPTTWVYANSNSAYDILAGIKKGHVGSHSPNGPQLQLVANADYEEEGGQETYEIMMGDSIPESAIGKEVRFRVRVFDAKMLEVVDLLSMVVVIKNGEPLTFNLGTSEDFCFDFTDTPQSGDYYRVELRQASLTDTTNFFGELTQFGWVVALTNPIYTW